MSKEDQYAPIKVVATRVGYYGNKMRYPGDKFTVSDRRKGSEIRGERIPSIKCLGSWMKREDDGDNPAEGKMQRALSRDFDLGLRGHPAQKLEDIMPLAPSHPPVDARVTPVAPSEPVADPAAEPPSVGDGQEASSLV
jgi:hypothetical protein